MGRIGRGWSLARQSLDVVLADGSLSFLVVLGAVLMPMLLFVGTILSGKDPQQPRSPSNSGDRVGGARA